MRPVEVLPHRRFTFPSPSATLLLLLTACCMLGCGSKNPPTYPVSGKVEFEDGEPVRIGSVEFRIAVPAESNAEPGSWMIARGKISEEGTFQLTTFEPNDGAIQGTHQVTVHQLVITEDLGFKAHGHGRRVSPKYADYATSGLTATVEAVPSSGKKTNQITLKLATDLRDKKEKR